MTTVTFGKHKGTEIINVPTDYLVWGSSKLDSPKWRNVFQTELDRRKQETKSLLDSNPDELLKKLEAEALRDIQAEIANSGAEHEYDRFDEYGEAENRAKTKLSAMQADKAMKDLKIEYAGLLGVDLKMMSRLENAYFNDELSRSNFGSVEKYNLAMDYFKKKDALLDVAMAQYF